MAFFFRFCDLQIFFFNNDTTVLIKSRQSFNQHEFECPTWRTPSLKKKDGGGSKNPREKLEIGPWEAAGEEEGGEEVLGALADDTPLDFREPWSL